MYAKNTLPTLAMIVVAFGVGFASQSPAQEHGKPGISKTFLDAHAPDITPSYSRSQIKKMIHDAKTSEDFARLADYFDYRSMEFEQKSQDQVKELQRLLALRFHAKTYATQVDGTRELIKRYKAQAEEYASRADAYRERASTGIETK